MISPDLRAQKADFDRLGWIKFPKDPMLMRWLEIAGPAGLATREDAEFRQWVQCEETWFVGVNALGNDRAGAVGRSGPLQGLAVNFIRNGLGFDGIGTDGIGFDRAQVSICYKGFPKPRKGENSTQFLYRQNRDGAHVDGLHPVGPERQRKLMEYQGFILGIPITETSKSAAPLVVWEGSHKIIASRLREALVTHSVDNWHAVDLSQPYHDARREAFAKCQRKVIHAVPGEAYLLHRAALHGVTKFADGARAPRTGRAIFYFRPEVARKLWFEG